MFVIDLDCQSTKVGQAGPSRWIGMKSEDGIVRLYPQSLVKQFQLKTNPEFSPADIIAEFNSDVDFWFEDDATPIKPTQYGFLYMTLHEFIHGLGFVSIWDPSPYFVTVNTTELLNKFAPKGTKFDSEDDFYAKFQNSAQYKIATDMLKYATTPLSFVNNTANDQLFYLETSLNPYQPGSSVSHVSQALYLKSIEFLMSYQEPQGKTLKDVIKNGGNYVGGSIGPKFLSILESLGYATADNPNPEIPTLLDPPFYVDNF
ncbi:8860_t:CDS:2 [Entrophospora sp. SA101]|nr:8860_t:CDS:2 [Entrophospora sp. SA101]